MALRKRPQWKLPSSRSKPFSASANSSPTHYGGSASTSSLARMRARTPAAAAKYGHGRYRSHAALPPQPPNSAQRSETSDPGLASLQSPPAIVFAGTRRRKNGLPMSPVISTRAKLVDEFAFTPPRRRSRAPSRGNHYGGSGHSSSGPGSGGSGGAHVAAAMAMRAEQSSPTDTDSVTSEWLAQMLHKDDPTDNDLESTPMFHGMPSNVDSLDHEMDISGAGRLYMKHAAEQQREREGMDGDSSSDGSVGGGGAGRQVKFNDTGGSLRSQFAKDMERRRGLPRMAAPASAETDTSFRTDTISQARPATSAAQLPRSLISPEHHKVVKTPYTAPEELAEGGWEYHADDKMWVKTAFPSLFPAGRRDVEMLRRWLDAAVEGMDTDGEPRLLVQRAQHIFATAMREIVRQVSVHCVERGKLLHRVWCKYLKLFDKLLMLSNDEVAKVLTMHRQWKQEQVVQAAMVVAEHDKEAGQWRGIIASLRERLQVEEGRISTLTQDMAKSDAEVLRLRSMLRRILSAQTQIPGLDGADGLKTPSDGSALIASKRGAAAMSSGMMAAALGIEAAGEAVNNVIKLRFGNEVHEVYTRLVLRTDERQSEFLNDWFDVDESEEDAAETADLAEFSGGSFKAVSVCVSCPVFMLC